MSRFSKAEAEARGWVFVHARDEFEVLTSGTQGESRITPATIVAEKYVSLPGQGNSLVHEEAGSMGLLLERIFAFEQQLESKQVKHDTPVIIDPATVPVNDGGFPQRTVLLPSASGDGPPQTITEAEWSSRGRSDAILTDDGMKFLGPIPGAVEGAEAFAAQKRAAEDENKAAADVGEAEQLDIDESQAVVDLPGGATGSTLIVRAGEENTADVSARKAKEEAAKESDKSLVAKVPESEIEVQPEATAPENIVEQVEDDNAVPEKEPDEQSGGLAEFIQTNVVTSVSTISTDGAEAPAAEPSAPAEVEPLPVPEEEGHPPEGAPAVSPSLPPAEPEASVT